LKIINVNICVIELMKYDEKELWLESCLINPSKNVWFIWIDTETSKNLKPINNYIVIILFSTIINNI